ncbi:transposase family protein [Paenibacillus dendritiformis]|uniref:transposase family protein n=1 Tax=Paenibacillus dendritiformis TaxID=130049 RepID=UPI00248BD39B|nr:transposase family protein [Paenibacillus dendritiformis]WGU97639.1 transposase family protein [Paenibacillus dendritiformis]
MHIEFNDQEQAWHLHLDLERVAVFACPRCSAGCKAYDSEIKHWRHLDFWDWKTFMHARMPRVKCTSCNKVTQVYAKWDRPLSHFTLMFEA